jgi:hypothetical protein
MGGMGEECSHSDLFHSSHSLPFVPFVPFLLFLPSLSLIIPYLLFPRNLFHATPQERA